MGKIIGEGITFDDVLRLLAKALLLMMFCWFRHIQK